MDRDCTEVVSLTNGQGNLDVEYLEGRLPDEYALFATSIPDYLWCLVITPLCTSLVSLTQRMYLDSTGVFTATRSCLSVVDDFIWKDPGRSILQWTPAQGMVARPFDTYAPFLRIARNPANLFEETDRDPPFDPPPLARGP